MTDDWLLAHPGAPATAYDTERDAESAARALIASGRATSAVVYPVTVED